VNHVGLASILASSGFHPPLEIALPIVAVLVIAKVVYALKKGRSPIASGIVVRCGRGHVFRTVWSPLGSLTSIRLGFARLQHCPVGHHWSLVRPVDDSDLTDDDRRVLDHNR
jgi:hypothetical protein